MPTHNDHNPMQDKLLDLIRGELDPAETVRLQTLLASDPALRARRASLEAFLAAAKQAHALPEDPDAGTRVAARILDRVRREEERAAREARRPAAGRAARWARLLAASVAVHVLALGVLAWTRSENGTGSPRGRDEFRGARLRVEPADEREGRDELAGLPPVPTEFFGADGEPTYDLSQRLALEEALEPEPTLPAMGGMEPGGMGGLDGELRPPAHDPRFAPFHPSVARLMLVRTIDVEKQRYLAMGGIDPDGTMRGVRYGLAYLAGTQDRRDGSFPPAPGRTSVWSTSLAVLPFLGEGNSSRGGSHAGVLEPAIGWLRRHAASADTAADRGVALVALAEDYMLCNGLLTPSESAQRVKEMAALAAALTLPDDGNAAPAEVSTRLWPSMGLAAAARVGIGLGSVADRSAQTWVPSAIAAPADSTAAALDPRLALVTGTAMLWGGGKPSPFPAWNSSVGPALLARIERDGGVRVAPGTPAPVRAEQTALVLLGLQLAYRTY